MDNDFEKQDAEFLYAVVQLVQIGKHFNNQRTEIFNSHLISKQDDNFRQKEIHKPH